MMKNFKETKVKVRTFTSTRNLQNLLNQALQDYYFVQVSNTGLYSSA